jgi:hypothetical protein
VVIGDAIRVENARTIQQLLEFRLRAAGLFRGRDRDRHSDEIDRLPTLVGPRQRFAATRSGALGAGKP